MGVRLYTPTTGRFLQTDPVEGGSCNAYDYTCADSVNNLDLDGRFCIFGRRAGRSGCKGGGARLRLFGKGALAIGMTVVAPFCYKVVQHKVAACVVSIEAAKAQWQDVLDSKRRIDRADEARRKPRRCACGGKAGSHV